MTLILLLEIASQGTWKKHESHLQGTQTTARRGRKRMRGGDWFQRTEQAPMECLERGSWQKRAQGRLRNDVPGAGRGAGWAKPREFGRRATHRAGQSGTHTATGSSLPWSHYICNQAILLPQSIRHWRLTPLAEWPTETNPADTRYSKDWDENKNRWSSKRLNVDYEWFLGSGSALSIGRGVWPWASCLMSPYLSFLIYKMTIITDSESQSCSQD